ncbi:hypothetical protein EW026_g1251 [Hermanssonia centrifuga]|uniref:Uncharacterized protein n=1 Tax=Hermanssonia centrifuga TaxID=98765 RepID=A0A4S4KT27_9APHY|nr:hypothetical protein EW026_g1251 [Hermanssonia centrifuga]
MLGVIQLEIGELEAAKQTFLTLIPPNPSAPSPPPPSAYLYLAQLSDDNPQEALQYYQSAVDIQMAQLKGKERAAGTTASNDDDAELRRNIVRALIGMVEIWMDPSYDLCFDPAAEKTCEDLLNAALQTDSGNTEALQALASVRLSQQRPEEAKQCLEQAWTAWKDFESDDIRLPPIPTRLALVKMFLELELYEPALLVLSGIMAFDDQEVEAWYLEGWCFFLMAEHAQEHGGIFNELTWEQLARDARDCLEMCKTLHLSQEHPDVPLLDHVRELINSFYIDAMLSVFRTPPQLCINAAAGSPWHNLGTLSFYGPFCLGGFSGKLPFIYGSTSRYSSQDWKAWLGSCGTYTPDFYWAEPILEGYFNSLSNALEVRIRTRSVNDKITYAAEMQSVLRELLTETSAHRMELIIIVLIAVEVVICLIRDGPELWHMVTDKKTKDSGKELKEAF